MLKIIPYLCHQAKSTLLSLGIVLVILIGYANHLAGVEISASIFYLFPISIVSWCAGRKEGGLIALAGSVSWFAADWYAGRAYSHPIIYYWNLAVMFGVFLVVNFTLSGLKIALEREKTLARVDPLTGVANARYFAELAHKEIERSRRYSHPLTLVYLDCDNFKSVNDQFGHQTGNRLLRLLADILQKNTRSTDIVTRMGGDEFAILMPETGEKIIPQALDRLRTRIVGALQEDGWPVTLSLGAAIYLCPPESVDEMIRHADRLMFVAKSAGKNTIKYKIFRTHEEFVPSSPLGSHSTSASLQENTIPPLAPIEPVWETGSKTGSSSSS